MRPADFVPPTAEQRDQKAIALLEQLASREGLQHYRGLVSELVPHLRETGAELARQEDGKLASVAEREAIANRAAVAIRTVILGALQVPLPTAKTPTGETG